MSELPKPSRLRPPPRGVIFDMDGTLLCPVLDFDAIRADLGLPPGQPVWEAIQAMPPEARAQALEILTAREEHAARTADLQPGARELLAALRARRLALGLLTRNSRRSVEIVLARYGLHFDAIATRDDAPLKPSAEPVLHLACLMNVRPAETLVVGDYLFDLQAGAAAGARTALLVNNPPPPDWADQADAIVYRLADILDLI